MWYLMKHKGNIYSTWNFVCSCNLYIS